MRTIFLIFFEIKFILNDEVDYEGGTDANGKSGYIDEGEYLVSPEITEGDGDVISKHGAISF